jgi:hypothetical protein
MATLSADPNPIPKKTPAAQKESENAAREMGNFAKMSPEERKSWEPYEIGLKDTGRIVVRGSRHTGGIIPEDGLYSLKEGEKVIPAPQKAYQHEVVEAMPNSPSAEGCGHWEIDGTSVKFVKG